jgi:hypothetical protein
MAQWHVQGQCHQPQLQLVRWIPNESVRLLPGTGVPRGRRFIQNLKSALIPRVSTSASSESLSLPTSW